MVSRPEDPAAKKSHHGKERLAMVWPDASEPFQMRASTDLMLLHPDGKQEVLVEGGKGAIADPYVSFDARWVYYTYFHISLGAREGQPRERQPHRADVLGGPEEVS